MAFGAIIAGIGFGLQAYGQMQASKQQARSLEEQAQVSEENAERAKEESLFNAERLQFESMKVIEGQKAQFAAAGLEGGSVRAVIMDSAINAELDRLSVVYGGDVRSKDFINQAMSQRRTAADVKSASLFQTLATGFQGTGSVINNA